MALWFFQKLCPRPLGNRINRHTHWHPVSIMGRTQLEHNYFTSPARNDPPFLDQWTTRHREDGSYWLGVGGTRWVQQVNTAGAHLTWLQQSFDFVFFARLLCIKILNNRLGSRLHKLIFAILLAAVCTFCLLLCN